MDKQGQEWGRDRRHAAVIRSRTLCRRPLDTGRADVHLGNAQFHCMHPAKTELWIAHGEPSSTPKSCGGKFCLLVKPSLINLPSILFQQTWCYANSPPTPPVALHL